MCMLSAQPEQESVCKLPHTLMESAVLCTIVSFVLGIRLEFFLFLGLREIFAKKAVGKGE